MATVDTCFVAVGCNRTPNACSWGTNNIILYASCNGVAVYNPSTSSSAGHVNSVRVAHSDRINSVQWIPVTGSVTEAISASADKTAVVWSLDGDELRPVSTLTGHSSSVTQASGVYIEASDKERPITFIATCSADCTVRIWRRPADSDSFTCLQTIRLGTGFALDAAWASLPGCNTPLLALGCDDQKIHLFTLQQSQFVKVQSLAGHEDWLRQLDFTQDDSGDVLLASCGQDCFIRLWRITPACQRHQVADVGDLQMEDVQDIKVKEITFSVDYEDQSLEYYVLLESVLMAHENWIYGIKWHPVIYKDGCCHQPMCLLSASMDKTMIIWRPDPVSGVWLDQVRVGEVGGNTLGLYGCQFSPDGRSILAHGYQGALHLWHFDQETVSWTPEVTVSGHYDAVQDIAWDPDGEFLISSSADQTMRLYVPWKRKKQMVTWHEVARPQIHGYDLQCLAMIGRFKLASGADEKVIRIFEAPRSFIKNFGIITGLDVSQELLQTLAEGASVPALGLSNKAVFEDAQQPLVQQRDELQPHPNEQYADSYFKSVNMNEPPTEENLLQNTLWPETQKLYGHGYEIFAVASNPQGTVLASSCKAAKAEHASVILWDTTTWRQIGHLPSHNLTVTQLAFSASGNYLLSVSRDRTWSMFGRGTVEPGSFVKVAGTDKKTSVHSRIIWSCCWSPDEKFFFTASRDKKVIAWASSVSNRGSWAAVSSHECPDSVTAVAVYAECLQDGSYLVAAGMDSGHIHLVTWNAESKDIWRTLSKLDKQHAHHKTVKRIQFKNTKHPSTDKLIQLASCGADHIVRIYDIHLDRL